MGIRIAGTLLFALLVMGVGSIAHADLAPTSASDLSQLSVQMSPSGATSPSWEEDLSLWTYRLLKDVRRWWIRATRLIERSAVYWLEWIGTAAALLLFGGVVSALDRRMLVEGWQRGFRTALTYAWISLVVFLRLVRDPRVAGRLRLVIPLALLYGIVSSDWLQTGSVVLDCSDELLVVGLASRWFVRQCPDAVIAQHAALARRRVGSNLPFSSEQRS